MKKRSDSALAEKVKILAPPGVSENMLKALTAAVENQMLARMWDKMHGPAGELTDFGHAVVEKVARDVWEQVREEQRPALTLVP